MSVHPLRPGSGEESPCKLPPGFRFHPTNEELVSYYLTQKVVDSSSVFQAIGEVDFNKCEPWDLPALATMGENTFYFFSLRDRKYPTGTRTNRATEAGYWKATGKDREVMNSRTGRLVGMKKTLVFYMGRAPKGEKTSWIMHEYRLQGESTAPDQEEWVVCRIFEKSAPSKKMSPDFNDNTRSNTEYIIVQPLSSLQPPQNLELPSPNSVLVKPNFINTGHSLSHPQCFDDYASIAGDETILMRFNSNAKSRRALELGDSLENLVSAWDVCTPDWTNVGIQDGPFDTIMTPFTS